MSTDPLQAPETREVEWRWAAKREQVTLPRQHWLLFDRLCELRGCSPDDLQLEISLGQPLEDTAPIASAMTRYLDEKLARGPGQPLGADIDDAAIQAIEDADENTRRRSRGIGW
jgi:hypothetical protein